VARDFRNNLPRKLPPDGDLPEAFASTDERGYLTGMLSQFAAILVSTFRFIFHALNKDRDGKL
jgi:hypothetical protein